MKRLSTALRHVENKGGAAGSILMGNIGTQAINKPPSTDKEISKCFHAD